MKRTIIPGPPGTGKTYHLINNYLKKEIEVNKISADKIAYLTFSNAATNEARKRILPSFPKIKDFPYICTMHSLGTRQLNIDTNTQLLKDEKWNAFKNFSQICKDLSFDSYFDPYTEAITYKNDHMKVIEYSRCKKISIMDAAIELDKKSMRIWKIETVNVDKPIITENTMKEPAFK